MRLEESCKEGTPAQEHEAGVTRNERRKKACGTIHARQVRPGGTRNGRCDLKSVWKEGTTQKATEEATTEGARKGRCNQSRFNRQLPPRRRRQQLPPSDELGRHATLCQNIREASIQSTERVQMRHILMRNRTTGQNHSISQCPKHGIRPNDARKY